MPFRRLINLLVKVVDLVDEPANQQSFLIIKSKEDGMPVENAVWTTAFVNDLPDSAFLHISPGGNKDGEGKTTPRSLRHLPYRDKGGKVDLPHLRNALARIPQMKGVDESTKKRLTEHARQLLEREGGGSTKEKSMGNEIKKDAGGAAGDASGTTADNEAMTEAIAAAETLLGAEQALAKQLGDVVQDAIQSVVLAKTMTPEHAAKAMKAAGDLVTAAMKEPNTEMRAAALGKAKELINRFHKSVTMMQPGPQVPNPAGAGGEPWSGITKPEGQLKPQFTAKGFTAGVGSSGNHPIPSVIPATPPEGAPPSNPKHPPVTQFPGGGDIANAVRKAFDAAAEAFSKAFQMPLDKKADSADGDEDDPQPGKGDEPLDKKADAAFPPLDKKADAFPPLDKKADAAMPPLDKKADAAGGQVGLFEKEGEAKARGCIGPQGSSEPPKDEITKALGNLADRMKRLEQGIVGPGSKGAPEVGTDGDHVEKSKDGSFWGGVV